MTSQSKKTLNKENLILLGAEHLAELLMDISKGNAVSQRTLRTAIAGSLGVDEASKEIRKRINTIARAKTYIDYDKKKSVLKDLESLRNQIFKQILPKNPQDSLDLMWSLLRLSNGIIQRSYDGSNTFHTFFCSLLQDLSVCAIKAKEKPYILAERILNDIFDNDYDQYDDLIPEMTEALGVEGLEYLKQKLNAEKTDKQKIYTIKYALEQIAAGLNDIDSYIALKSKNELKVPQIAADVALKLLKMGRIQEAFDIIENADCSLFEHQRTEWATARIMILEALGKHDEAQAFRYRFFQDTLSVPMLKEYLKNVPEFQNFKEEQKALDFAVNNNEIHHAIYFLTQWHAPKNINEIILKRHTEIDGDFYEILPNAAKTLSSEYPLGATLILRSMVSHALDHAKTQRYKHIAKHLQECHSLAQYIHDYQGHLTHENYLKDLKHKHGKKYSFWNLMQKNDTKASC